MISTSPTPQKYKFGSKARKKMTHFSLTEREKEERKEGRGGKERGKGGERRKEGKKGGRKRNVNVF